MTVDTPPEHLLEADWRLAPAPTVSMKSGLSSEATRINDLGASIQSTLLLHRLGALKGDQALQLENWPQVLLAKSFQYLFPTD